MERLAVEDMLAGHPSVRRVNVTRDERGAVIGIRVSVGDEAGAKEVRRLLSERIGSPFTDERLAVDIEAGPGEDDLKADPREEASRIQLVHVSSTLGSGKASVEVGLALNGRSASATRTGKPLPGAALRLGAEAALEAIAEIDPVLHAGVKEVGIVDMGGDPLVIAVIEGGTRRGRSLLYGASGLGEGPPEAAAARAVLSAVNRLIG